MKNKLCKSCRAKRNCRKNIVSTCSCHYCRENSPIPIICSCIGSNKISIESKNISNNTQKQHYITKGITKNWGINKTHFVHYFNGINYGEGPVSYKIPFQKKGIWSKEIEKKFETELEGPVINKIFKKDVLNIKDQDKLISFCFLQFIRFTYIQNADFAAPLLSFLLSNAPLSEILSWTISESTDPLCMTEYGIITTFNEVDPLIVYSFPINPYLMVSFWFKKPWESQSPILNIKEIYLKSFGIPGTKLVTTEKNDISELKRLQLNNLEEYLNNEIKYKEITLKDCADSISIIVLKKAGFTHINKKIVDIETFLFQNDQLIWNYFQKVREVFIKKGVPFEDRENFINDIYHAYFKDEDIGVIQMKMYSKWNISINEIKN